MLQRLKQPKFKAPRQAVADWDNFRGGLNSLLRPTELAKNELAQMENLMLIGRGVPTKRWGTQNYFLAGVTGYGRGLFHAKSAVGTSEVLGITDWGLLVKRSGASYTVLTGASWGSGYNLEATQLNNRVYLVNGQRELVRYDFSTLTGFPTLSVPAGVAATNLSGATGDTTYSWRIAATSQVGETLGSAAVAMASLPQELSDTSIRVQWTPVSAASGDLTGYNIYRGSPGDETWLAFVDDDTSSYDDAGLDVSQLRVPQTKDTTGGPIAKWIIRYEDRLILAGISGEPTKIMISGRVPNQDKFTWPYGGGYVLVDPDTGDEITGLAVHQGKIIVFKENSVWQVTLSTITVGNFTILEPSYELITASQGCTSHRSIVPVENDLLFCNRQGVYILGFEPNILAAVLRTNELSVKIRPFFEAITPTDFDDASANYFDHKYVLSFPGAKKCIVFDRERAAWVGPWTTGFGTNKFIKYVDSGNVERLLGIDAEDNYVSEFSKTLNSDKGTAFRTLLKTRKEDFGDWTIFKTINESFLSFRNVLGSVNINIFLEGRAGEIITAKTFSIVSQKGVSGWGTDQWGLTQWGLSKNDAELSSEELIRQALLYKTARTFQVELISSATRDNYELLGIKTFSTLQGRGSSPSDWRAS